MKKLAAAILLACAAQAHGATYYVDTSCANNGNGQSMDCAASGGGTGAYNVMSSISSSADGQVEIAIGNTVYLKGLNTASWNPGGVVGNFVGTYFQLRCDHPSGSGGFSVGSGTIIGIGGGSRNGIKIGPGCSFGGGAANGISLGSSSGINGGFQIFDNDFIGLTSAGIAIEPAQDATNQDIKIFDNSFTNIGVSTAGLSAPLGEGVRLAPARNASGTVSGLVQRVEIFNNTFTATLEKGRYGVSAYPCTTCSLAERATSGRVRELSVYNNRFTGDFNFSAINFSNDVDDSVVAANSFDGTFGGAVIHVGGQGTIGTCNASSDNNVIRDHRRGSGTPVSGGIITPWNPADGAGIMADECAAGTKIRRNEVTGNAVAGIYLNDADNTVMDSNIVYLNGDNEIHVHGIGINFLARRNSTYHDASSPSGVADQGLDGWQIDGTVGTGTTLTGNLIICGPNVPKCVDADVAITESYNAIYHPDSSKRAEGFTPAGTDVVADPGVSGGTTRFATAQDFCPLTGSAIKNVGTVLGIPDFYRHTEPATPNIGALNTACGNKP